MKAIRRLICLLLAAALLCGLLPSASAASYSGTVDNSSIRWSVDLSTGVLTISGKGDMPYTHSTFPWYTYRREIKKVVIQSGVTNIGNLAFYDCHAMEEISIPDSVTQIKQSAFTNCASLRSIRLPGTLKHLEGNAFSGCSELRSIDIPAGVKTISGEPFQNCYALSTVTLHEGLETIGEYAFQGLPIASITIPSTVKQIGRSAFENCTALSQVRFSEGLQELGTRAFCSTDLHTVILPASLRTIAHDAFGSAPLEQVVVHSRNCAYPSDFSGATYGYARVYAYLGSTTHELWRNGVTFTLQPIYFTDVQPMAWYYDAVRYAKENDLFKGVSETTFEPDSPMTRAMAVTVLWRYASQLPLPPASEEPTEPTAPATPVVPTTAPKPDTRAAQTFTDVPEGSWYAEAVTWAADNGIVLGVGGGKFNPNGTLTREQLVTILYRFAQWVQDEVSAEGSLEAFADADRVDTYARTPAIWAVQNEILNGETSGGRVNLSPKGSATRAQVSAILMRYIENVRAAAHPQLYVYADEAELPILTRAAEAYGKEHPALTIHVSQTTARDFGRDYLLDGRRDLFLAPNRFTQEQIIGWYVTDSQWLVVFARRPHFAVASGDPKGIGSVKNLLSKLRAHTAVLGYLEGLSTEQSYGESVLQFLGCTYSEVKALPSQRFESNKEIAAAIAEGTVDAGVFWGAEVKQYGLTALPDVPYALDTGAPQDSYAVLPVSSRGHEQAVAFAQWMADHPELFDEAQ